MFPVLEGTILLIVLVIVSNIISHYLIKIPTALIQVTLGLLAALIFAIKIEINTDWFMLLFVAPLLFNDGRHFPKKDLWKLRIPILGNSILLVFLTTIIGGYIMYWVMDGKLPLAAAFALVAILSPTDPVAVNGIAEQVKLPVGVLRLVRGESLVNDASGLIAFKYAIAAMVTGYFSLATAISDFFYMALVGLAAGIILEWFVIGLKEWLSIQGIRDVILHTLLQILTPFMIYMIVEEVFHASGVIAVVAAGVVASHQHRVSESRMAEVQIVTERTWDVIIYLLNGIMFLILGIELPFAMGTALENSINGKNYQLFGYVLLLWLVILIIRILWTYSYMWFDYSYGKFKRETPPDIKIAIMSGLTGVRGAVTMAGILSIPALLNTGFAFPGRASILFIASGVIIVTLVAATIALPFFTKSKRRFETSGDDLADFITLDEPRLTQTDALDKREAEARIHIMNTAVQVIEQESRPENRMAVYDLLHEYDHLIRRMQMEYNSKETTVQFLQDEVEIRLIAINAEILQIEKMIIHQEVNQKVAELYIKQLVQRKRALKNRWFAKFNRALLMGKRVYRQGIRESSWSKKSAEYREQHQQRLNLERETAKIAIQRLSLYMKKEQSEAIPVDKSIVYHLIVEYRNKIERIKRFGEDYLKEYTKQLQEVRLKALNAERGDIQRLYEAGDISANVAVQLRRFVNYRESSVMDLGNENDE
ncbi:cation:proton antiporter [Carnobacterium gallinarum]|uniref:cation:proton antiporter n=1 Tax=Carnobacterium gallinarum TaxID=2749 RepID=UPI00054D48EB|nr:sodium:proton antiporter [Carnobacterium gallinarum]